MACREAFSWLKELNYNNICLESDCQIVIEAIPRYKQDFSYTGPIVEQCYNLLSSFQFSLCHFIPRPVNQIAHALARSTGFQSVRLSWDVVPPYCI